MRASRCWRRSSTCSIRRTAWRPRCGNRGTAPAPGSTRSWSRRSKRVAAQPDFWEMLRSDDLQQADLRSGARRRHVVRRRGLSRRHRGRLRPGHRLQKPYTSGHSERVTLFTDLIAEQLGFAPERAAGCSARRCCTTSASSASATHSRQARQARCRRMGGDAAARRLQRDDPSRIAAFEAIWPPSRARITSGSTAKAIRAACRARRSRSKPACITTADIFDALTADRPYRAAMPEEGARHHGRDGRHGDRSALL